MMRNIAIGLILVLTGSCGEQKPPAPPKPPPTAAEVEATIRQNVRYRDGFLLVHDTLLRQLSVLPGSSHWRVSCRIGLSVHFGGSGEEAAELAITWRMLSREDCEDLALVAARTVTAITQGR